jgi:replicative DNA helicase
LDTQHLTKFSQENILCLLTFDTTNCQLVRNAITIDLFDGIYKVIVHKLMDYIDRYHVAPQEHIADELEEYLLGANGEKYRDVITAIYTMREHFNATYVTEKLTAFLRSRNFEIALYDAAALHQQGKIEEAQQVMRVADSVNLTLFDPGIKVTDLHLLSSALDNNDIFPTGIRALDDIGVGPGRKQILVYLALKSTGKTWFCIQASKVAMLLGYKVAHISLEISKEQVLQRYVQCLLGLTKWRYDTLRAPILALDDQGVPRIDLKTIQARSLEEDDILEHISEQYKKYGPRYYDHSEHIFKFVDMLDINSRLQNIRIKDFPSGLLTMGGLRTYLDGLDRTENFTPDILIVDMPRNMKLNIDEFRLSMDQLYIDLRGLAVERNMAVIAPHQINRKGAGAKFITGEHISEDWGILGTADTGIIYNQKPMEQKAKIARLFVDRGKSVRSQFTVLITQNYDVGQYVTDSIKLPDNNPPDNISITIDGEPPNE